MLTEHPLHFYRIVLGGDFPTPPLAVFLDLSRNSPGEERLRLFVVVRGGFFQCGVAAILALCSLRTVKREHAADCQGQERTRIPSYPC